MVLSRVTCTPRFHKKSRGYSSGELTAKAVVGTLPVPVPGCQAARLPCCHTDAMLPHRGYGTRTSTRIKQEPIDMIKPWKLYYTQISASIHEGEMSHSFQRTKRGRENRKAPYIL
jgi:hypothetical protein